MAVLKRSLIGALASLGVMASVWAAQANQGVGNATAFVVEPITIEENQSLSFGSFVPGPSEGTVTISTAGLRSLTGGINAGPVVGTQAQFDIGGTGGAAIAVGAISGTTLTSGGDSMAVAFNTTGAPTSLDGGGNAIMNVGATLTVPGSQPPGTYTGSFTVTVSYN